MLLAELQHEHKGFEPSVSLHGDHSILVGIWWKGVCAPCLWVEDIPQDLDGRVLQSIGVLEKELVEGVGQAKVGKRPGSILGHKTATTMWIWVPVEKVAILCRQVIDLQQRLCLVC